MTEEVQQEQEQEEKLSPEGEAAWREFTKRLRADRMIEFSPKSRDVCFDSSRVRIGYSLSLYVQSVLLPLPRDMILELSRVLKIVFGGSAAFVVAISSMIVLPLLFLARRLILTVGAILGMLGVDPTPQSMADEMNIRLRKIRDEMEDEGYELGEFWSEVNAEEIDDEKKTFLMRKWKDR